MMMLLTRILHLQTDPSAGVGDCCTHALQVALVRLCYGEASQEMVQALCDLAEGYAKEGLWPQVGQHTVGDKSNPQRRGAASTPPAPQAPSQDGASQPIATTQYCCE